MTTRPLLAGLGASSMTMKIVPIEWREGADPREESYGQARLIAGQMRMMSDSLEHAAAHAKVARDAAGSAEETEYYNARIVSAHAQAEMLRREIIKLTNDGERYYKSQRAPWRD